MALSDIFEVMLRSWDWKWEAACKDRSELFFSLARGHNSKRDREAAIAICQTCPVRTECLMFAEENQEEYGVWGGKDFGATVREELNSRVRKYRKRLRGFMN